MKKNAKGALHHFSYALLNPRVGPFFGRAWKRNRLRENLPVRVDAVREIVEPLQLVGTNVDVNVLRGILPGANASEVWALR